MATFGGLPLIDHDNLEEYADPVDYDRRDSSDTGVAFYAALAREAGGPVLEIACGTGRVAIPIARQGFAVTGLDVVPAMLERARFKAEAADLPVRWVEGDARDFDLGGERFRLIFLTGNAFQAFLTNADQEALLGRVRAHLHEEGLFAFETRNPRWRTREDRDEDPDGLFVCLETRAEEEALPPHTDAEGREVRESRTRTYDHVAQVLHWTSYRCWHEGARERVKITRTALRYTFPQELAALLHHNGFTIVRRYGDWDGEPLTAASPSIIVVCRKKRAS
jgi:SAM-dependent methyltransferase